MCTLPRKTTEATVPPMSAAAMLSRKDESTKIRTSSTNPPFQPSGRYRGITAGTWRVLEVLGQQREAHQQAEEVRERDPLVPEDGRDPCEPRGRAACP